MMETIFAYVLKSFASLLVLYLFYAIFLSKERMPVFKRFYLLASLVYSCIIPFIQIPVNDSITSVFSTFGSNEIQQGYYEIRSFTSKSAILVDFKAIIYTLYFIVTLVMLARFVFNLYRLSRIKKGNSLLRLEGVNIALTNQLCPPYSFYSTILIS